MDGLDKAKALEDERKDRPSEGACGLARRIALRAGVSKELVEQHERATGGFTSLGHFIQSDPDIQALILALEDALYGHTDPALKALALWRRG